MKNFAKTSAPIHADETISAYGAARSTFQGAPLGSDEPRRIDAYWRAGLYPSWGMLYLKENPLLREPLKIEQTKPRLLGHWGSDAGQSFTHMPANMRDGFAAIIAILALIFALAYQRSQQVVVVHAATRQSHE